LGDPPEAIIKIYPNLIKALDLDPNSANSHYIQAVIAVWAEYDWTKGEREFRKALELNPSDALCRAFYSHLLSILGKKQEALYQGQQAYKLDPERPFVLGLHARSLNWAFEFESARRITQKALEIEPNHYFATGQLAKAYKGMGDYEKWFEIVNKRFAWNSDSVMARNERIFREEGYIGVIKERIRINEEVHSKGDRISFTGQARRYLEVKNYDKAMDCYEKAYQIRDPNLPYVSNDHFMYPELKENIRYIDFLKKLRLPLP
jgi:tetratricopeptide (TPR) repeat protein